MTSKFKVLLVVFIMAMTGLQAQTKNQMTQDEKMFWKP